MHQSLRFSLRGILILTAAVAVAITIAMAWLPLGAIIGSTLFVVSIVGSMALLLARHKTWGRLIHHCSVATLLFIVFLYASFGPATWAMARYNTPVTSLHAFKVYSFIYVPIATGLIFSPEPIRSASIRYTAWWMPNGVKFRDWGVGIGWSVPGSSYTVVSY
jgi:hypothetical protein